MVVVLGVVLSNLVEAKYSVAVVIAAVISGFGD